GERALPAASRKAAIGRFRTPPSAYLRARAAHGRAHLLDVRTEVLVELLGELRRLLIVGGAVLPGALRFEDGALDVRARGRHLEAEERLDTGLDAVERAVEGRVQHGARRRQAPALADAVGAAGPAGVEQPHAHA